MWEHVVVSGGHSRELKLVQLVLDKYQQEGWELVSACDVTDDDYSEEIILFFKRPKK